MSELLPCPFCGGEPLCVDELATNFVLCLGCSAETAVTDDKEAAIAAWNRRAQAIAPAGAAVRAFREYLDVHEVSGRMDGRAVDDMALDLARIALRFAQPAPGAEAWIPVCERLPEIGIPVLVYTPRTEYLQHAIDEWVIYREAPVPFSSATIETGEGWGGHDYEDVTHWQPLPAPPAAHSAGKGANNE